MNYEAAISKISVWIRVEALIIISSNTIINNNETLYNYISHPVGAAKVTNKFKYFKVFQVAMSRNCNGSAELANKT
jgi:hypothetical protein